MFIFSKKNCFKFIFALFVALLLVALIPFNAIRVSAVQGNGMYEIYVIDKKTNKPIEGAFVEIDSDDDAYRNDFPNNGRKRTDSKGAVVYNLEQYFDSRNWINIRFKIAVTAPGTGYKNYEGYIWPNASSDQWQSDYTIQLTPSDFMESDYLKKQIDCIDIPYDSKSHDAHEFLDIKDNNAEIRYKNNIEPSFTIRII